MVVFLEIFYFSSLSAMASPKISPFSEISSTVEQLKDLSFVKYYFIYIYIYIYAIDKTIKSQYSYTHTKKPVFQTFLMVYSSKHLILENLPQPTQTIHSAQNGKYYPPLYLFLNAERLPLMKHNVQLSQIFCISWCCCTQEKQR